MRTLSYNTTITDFITVKNNNSQFMNRLNFFKGLSIGLCLSAMMWWGMYKVVDTIIPDSEIVCTDS